jgi:PAS domain-containing protein
MQISANVRQIKEYTKTLEERELIKDYNKYYYYAMFYQNLLNDKQSYSQMVSNLKNMIMVRNMRKKSMRFGASMNDINDVGFSILSYDDDKNVGRFIYCNKICCQIFGVSEERIIGESVANIMPENVRMHHGLFVKRFQQEGMPRIFGRVRNMFIRDFADYIVPVQFYINFHYSSQFNYSLILHVDPILSVTYFGS